MHLDENVKSIGQYVNISYNMKYYICTVELLIMLKVMGDNDDYDDLD